MHECQQCGEANQASSRFCVVCGTPLAVAPGGLPTAPPPAAAKGPAPAPARAAPPMVLSQPVFVAAVPPGNSPTPDPARAPAAGGTGRPSAAAVREPAAEFPLDGPRTLVGFLVSFDNIEVGQYWPVHQGRNVLGRQGAATGLDIEIAHPTTSSLHASLLAAARPGRIVLEDTNSTNGTFVNDNRLAPGQRWELRDGDRVRFGLFDAVIKIIDRT
jgi:hypothetical protein